jgi:anti-anti-sigma factor
MIEIETNETQDLCTVNISGRMDATTFQKFQDEVLPLAQKADGPLILDLSGLEYISSMGLRALLIVAKECARKGSSIRLTCVRPEVYSVLHLSGFNTFMEIERHAG